MVVSELNEKLNEIINGKKMLYHGGHIKFTKIEPKFMLAKNSNAQEGVGIYFTPYLEVAHKYGNHIMYVIVDDSKEFINSHDIASDVYVLNDIEKMIDLMKVYDKEELYYYITNWMEVDEDLSEEELKEVFKTILPKMLDNEVRNFHIELAEIFGVVNFVNAWNKIFGHRYYGTYNPRLEFYAVMNTKLKVKVLE